MFKPRIDRISYGGATITQEEKDAINAVIDSQGGRRWTIGPESEAFEAELAKTTGVRRAVVVNSGSSALLVALAALKLPKGANVIIPALNFPTAFNAIIQNRYNPVVVDCDKNMLLDLDKVARLMGEWKIEAVVAVNVASNPIDLVKLRDIVGFDVKIVLDNCDGYGTKLHDLFVEELADVSCVSFHAAHIITTGEGGAILTDDNKIANTALKMREWGRASGTDNIYKYPGFPKDYRERYVYEEIGWNLKPLELQCAMGRVQLKKLEQFKQRRKENYDKLKKVFDKHPLFETVETILGADVCWFSFPFYCRGIERERVMATLEANNIECRTIFSGNITKHPAYQDVSMSIPLDNGKLPHADDVMENGVFISVHPSITDEMIAFIDEVLGSL
jgi:CDP-4-dehydro-6-deoxyglucose reductase, E1